jgi:predicted dehydrogenase
MTMRHIVVGLGNLGLKRQATLGRRCVATVDPFNSAADYREVQDVPLATYDAAVLSVPNQVKIELLHYLLAKGKHVLVEKPLLFPDLATSRALQALAGQSGAVWHTSYNHRFEPLLIRLKRLLDEGVIGRLYHARLVYGNGTVQNSIGTWRDAGWGVLEDLGCHLMDLTEFLFHYASDEYVLWEASMVESHAFDHCVFATADRQIVLECATTVWKNTFTVDVYGELGSLHLRGLSKWGPCELQVHKRVFPSGVPTETREVLEQGDRSWFLDLGEFERRVQAGITSYHSDLRISIALHRLGQEAAKLSQGIVAR